MILEDDIQSWDVFAQRTEEAVSTNAGPHLLIEMSNKYHEGH